MKRKMRRFLAMALAVTMVLQQGSTLGVLAVETEPMTEAAALTAAETQSSESETKAPEIETKAGAEASEIDANTQETKAETKETAAETKASESETKAPETKASESETKAPETKAETKETKSETQASESETKAPETKSSESETKSETQTSESETKSETQTSESGTKETELKTQTDETTTESESNPGAAETASEKTTESELAEQPVETESELETATELVTEELTEAETETETEEPVVLEAVVTQEVFQKTVEDATIPMVKYTVKVANKAAKTEAEGVSLKVLLADAVSYKKEEGETLELVSFESLGKAIESATFENEELTEADKAAYANGGVVLWKDQKIAAGEEKTFVFFAEVKDGQTDTNALRNRWIVNGKAVAEDKIQWMNTELLEVLPTVAEPQTYKYEDEKVSIKVIVPEGVELPYGVELRVKPVPEESKEYKAAVEAVEKANPDVVFNEHVFYDICFVSEGKEVEPVGGDVSVQMKFKDTLKTDVEDVSGEPTVVASHIQDNGELEDVTDEVKLNKKDEVKSVAFDTDSFTIYGVGAGTENDYMTEDTIPSYSLQYLLEGYNAVAFGNLTMNMHTMGGILVQGSLDGYSQNGYSDSPLANPSYIKGRVQSNESGLAGGMLNGRATYPWKPLYVGTTNTVNDKCDILDGEGSNGGKYLNGKEIVYNKTNSTYNGSGPIYRTDNYVDWITLKAVLDSNVAYLNNNASEELLVPQQSAGDYSTGQNGSPYSVALGSSIKLRLGDKNADQFHIVLTGDGSVNNTKTVINIMDEGTVYVPIIKDVENGSLESNASGMSIVFTFPNAEKVILPNASTYGHVIAPDADIDTHSNNYAGCLVGQNITLNGEGHTWPYTGETLVPTQAGLHAVKQVDGKTPDENQVFNFYLDKLENGEWKRIDEKPNIRAAILFKELVYAQETDVGDHWYLIREDQTEKDGYIVSQALYVVKVSVKENQSGSVKRLYIDNTTYYKTDITKAAELISGSSVKTDLLTEVPYSWRVVFNNTTTTTQGKGSLKVTKQFTGDSKLTAEQKNAITFKVYGPKAADGSKGPEAASFTYAQMKDGVYTVENLAEGTYTVEETGVEVTGYNVKTTYKVGTKETKEVSVELEKTAEMTVTNAYSEKGLGKLDITKKFTGDGKLTAEQKNAITFKVYGPKAADGSKGPEVASFTYAQMKDGVYTVENLAEGTYTVEETGAEVTGYNVTTTYEVDGEETQEVSVELEKTAEMTVTNAYSEKGLGKLEVTKKFTGDGKLTAEQKNAITFKVYGPKAADGSKGPEAASFTYAQMKDGVYTVENLAEGTYTVEETGAEVTGYNVETIYKVGTKEAKEVSVELEQTAKMTVTNAYTEHTSIVLGATKVFDRTLTGDDFTFRLQELNADGTVKTGGVSLTAKNKADGVISFAAIPYKKAGTYYYQISEVIPTGEEKDASVLYDATVKKVTVTVTEKDGKLVAASNVEARDAVFTNRITSVKVSKTDVVTGEELEGAHIQILDKEGNIVEEWDSTKEAHEVKGLKTGETYTLKETVAPDGYTVTAETAFTLKEDGTVDSGATTTKSRDGVLLVEDSTNKVSILKVDESGTALAGAKLVVKDKDGKAVGEPWKTDGKAHDITGLAKGSYTLSEVEAPEGYQVSADIPFEITGKETAGQVITVEMKDAKIPKTDKRSLTVTKRLRLDGITSDVGIKDAVYYVALFSDEAKTQRVSDVKPVVFKNSTASSVTFENLAKGTYYVGETDENGTLLVSKMVNDKVIFYPEYDTTAKVEFEGSRSETASAEFTNVYVELTSGLYLSGQLTVTKKVLLNGVEGTSDETYYARVFFDKAMTSPASDVLALDLAGGTSASVTVTDLYIGETIGSSATYYVAETDKDGTPLDPDAVTEFEISIDKSEIVMDANNSAQEVVITNSYTEEETETETETEVDEKKTAPKTGDDTDFMRYLLLMALSAGTCAVTFDRKRRRARRVER